MSVPPLNLSTTDIRSLCRRWQIRRLALFGSILRNNGRPDSDVDVLVVFDPAAAWSSWDLLDLRDELGRLFDREIDLVELRSLTNPFRRRSILRSQQVIYDDAE
jgi:uncharacterized protein